MGDYCLLEYILGKSIIDCKNANIIDLHYSICEALKCAHVIVDQHYPIVQIRLGKCTLLSNVIYFLVIIYQSHAGIKNDYITRVPVVTIMLYLSGENNISDIIKRKNNLSEYVIRR